MRISPIIILTVTLGMIYHHPLSAQYRRPVPFTSTPTLYFSSPSQPLKIISFTGSIRQNRVLLNWTVVENQEADQFEVERSTDGKTFETAALVFGTGKNDTGKYEFYEKTNSKKLIYRIKAIHKDQAIQYSDSIIAEAEKN